MARYYDGKNLGMDDELVLQDYELIPCRSKSSVHAIRASLGSASGIYVVLHWGPYADGKIISAGTIPAGGELVFEWAGSSSDGLPSELVGPQGAAMNLTADGATVTISGNVQAYATGTLLLGGTHS